MLLGAARKCKVRASKKVLQAIPEWLLAFYVSRNEYKLPLCLNWGSRHDQGSETQRAILRGIE
jgi:hypothetical protein